jgi:surface protein
MVPISSTISIISDETIESIFKYNNIDWKIIFNKINDGINLSLNKVHSKFSYENTFYSYYLNKFKIFKNVNNLLDYAKIFMSSIDKNNFKIEEKNQSINLIIEKDNINLKLYIKNIFELIFEEINKLKNEIKDRKEFKNNKEIEKPIPKKNKNEIIKINQKENNNLNIVPNNTIKTTYLIEEEDVNKEIKIIDFNNNPQKEDIKNNCEIYLNNQQINSPYKFEKEGEYTIILNFKKELEDISYLFYNCLQLIEIDLSNFKTQNVKSMKCLFSTCRRLKKTYLKNINTNEVTDMKDMFSNCNDLEELDLSSFQTQNVETMENMFYYCTSLKKLNIKNFDIRNVTTMKNMFSHCENLTDLDLSNFINENVEDISFMFSNCKNLKKLDFSKFEYHQKMKKNGIFNDIEGNLKYFLINFKP